MRRHPDEDDIRPRAGPATRPRTRTRPTHADAATGVVIAVDRGRYRCRVGDELVTAMRARELRDTSIVVGDRVALAGDATGAAGTLARVVRIEPRTTVLRRTADDTDPIERPIVANADQLVMVVSLANPPPRPRFVDRCLVAAFDGGLEPLLCLTKRDLGVADALLSAYEPLGVRAVAVSRDAGDEGFRVLQDRLRGRTSVLIGHSGVGKSTLVNRLVPDAERAIGEVTDLGRGRHTSSSAVALALPGGGWVIDTPGVRSFGLGAVTPERVLAAFPDLAPGLADCPRSPGGTPAGSR
ncbi:MAG: ribosome small subunit-dependent GTPase A [Frankia sp.]|nr:ribosome small subunit-dependent GTPase A [Frankia sp.]